MSFIVTGLTALGAGSIVAGTAVATAGASMLYKGGAAEGWWGGDPQGEIETGETAAYDLYQQKRGLLGKQEDISTDVAKLQYDVAGQQYGIAGEQYDLSGLQSDLSAKTVQSQYTSGMRDLSMQTGGGISSIRAGGSSAARQSGLVSGTAQQQAAGQERTAWGAYKSDTQRYQETKQLSMQGIDLERQGADIGYKVAGQAYDVAGKKKAITMDEIALKKERGELTEEEAYEYQKTALTEAAGPTDFFAAILG